MGVNYIVVSGHIGTDGVELRYLPSGKPCGRFSVASNRTYKQGDELKKDTTWIRVITWGKQAEICKEFLDKGSHVLVEGRLNARKYEDKDGIVRHTTEIVASHVEFLDKPDKSNNHTESQLEEAFDE